MASNFATGTVEGTGSAINVSVGWQPDYVKVWNIDDAGTLYPIIEWHSTMGAGKGFKYLKIADNGSTGNLSSTYVTTGGITAYAGTVGTASTAGTGEGFTIGTDSDLNANGETIVWIAARNAR